MFTLPCILFAGGKSSRMGQDKALLSFGGYTSLAEFQYNRLTKLFSNVYISTKTREKFDFEAQFIVDAENSDFAPTAGFVSAFESLKCESFFALSVDTPFVDVDTIETLLHADESHLDAVIAKTPSGTHPLCGIYHHTLLESFQQMQREGDHRLGKLLSMKQTRFVEFENEEIFMNLNHPHEYEEALSRYNNKK
ncbi:MAG: molybdenum cofactor guanylyltransferase MobA [Candidatus Babeliales bacterium]